jgi:hypothetical protein
MKKKSLIIIGIISILFTGSVLDVRAGTVNFSIQGSDTVSVNNNIELTVRAADITGFNGGLATAQGDISYDNNYLEYVKYQDSSPSLTVSFGSTTKRFVALGMNGEAIKSSEDIITLTFRAKQVGSTTVGINNMVVGDVKAISHSANVSVKNITIVDEKKEDNSNDNNDKKDTSSNKGNNSGSKKNNSSNSNKNNSNNSTASNKSSNNLLDSLTINNAKMSPTFSKDVTSYSITVPKDVNKLDLDYKLSDSKASVKVVGNDNLKSNKNNVVEIIVTAEDGSTKTYTLNVSFSSDSSSNKLASLEVKESSLYPKFDSDVNEYKIKLKKNVSKLTIDAIAKDKNSKVEIIDNKNLNKNNSVVLVKVTDKNGFSNYYKLKVDNTKKQTIFGIEISKIIWFLLIMILILIFLILIILIKRRKDDDDDEDNDNKQVVSNSDVNNDDLYDDIVTKEEIIGAIEEKNAKKLKMLLTQEEANKLKEELKREEREDR